MVTSTVNVLRNCLFKRLILRSSVNPSFSPSFTTSTGYLATSSIDSLKMKSFAVLALAATALAQSPPAGCQASSSGTFNIQTVNVTSSATKRGLESRQLSGALTLTLKDGILKDQAGRQGYIASNYQ